MTKNGAVRRRLARLGTQWYQRHAVRLNLDPTCSIEFVCVPAGAFLMGSNPSQDNFAQPDEMPQHSVSLSEFFIGRYPVTNAQYAAFARSQGKPFELRAGRENHPVVHVSWEEATAFSEWASQVAGRRIRLPSEAEWEKAARSDDGRLYPWGNAWNPRALNSADGGAGDVTPVDMHSPAGDSPYGAADMVGNVWEWIADWYASDVYEAAVKAGARIDPAGPDNGSHRVLRGGCHFFRQSGTRAARRFKYNPRYRCYDIGFRVAADA